MRSVPEEAPGVGLDAPVAEGWPGHEIRPGLVLKRWPSVYLTPRVNRIVRLHRMHARYPLRTDGVVHWPAPLARALFALDEEVARG
jgi:hypothetical protein